MQISFFTLSSPLDLAISSARALGALKISLHVAVDNERAVKLYQRRFGFEVEGTLKMEARERNQACSRRELSSKTRRMTKSKTYLAIILDSESGDALLMDLFTREFE